MYFFSTVCLLLLSCTKNDDKTLTLSYKNIEFTSIGGELEIAVIANTSWETKYEANWFSAETSGNMGNGSVVIRALPNYSTTERIGRIFVTTLSGGIIEEITISQQGNTDTPFQVYDERNGTPFKESIYLIGLPCGSSGSFDVPGRFPASTFGFGEYPWEIKGEVRDGIMVIDFPHEKFELTSDYKSFTEGLTIAQIFIEDKNNWNRKIGLHKIGDDNDSRVYILYVSDDFSNELVSFKSGWNFIEIFRNPNWVYGSNEQFNLIGAITQDINFFLEEGYRWQIELWI